MASDNIDALLQIASMDGDEVIELTDVDAFISVNNISEGPHKVWDWQVYWHYKNWSINPMSRSDFNAIFKEKFKQIEVRYADRVYGRFYHKLSVPLEVSEDVKKANKPPYSENQKRQKKRLNQEFKRKQNKLSQKPDGL